LDAVPFDEQFFFTELNLQIAIEVYLFSPSLVPVFSKPELGIRFVGSSVGR
jgi:hypothetical protein